MKSKAIYLKKLSYKSKGYFSVESNEVYYRIYTLTLKRVEQLGLTNKAKELSELLAFLETIMGSKFVQIFNDLQFDEIKEYLLEQIFAKSQLMQDMPCKGSKFNFKQNSEIMYLCGSFGVFRSFLSMHRHLHCRT